MYDILEYLEYLESCGLTLNENGEEVSKDDEKKLTLEDKNE